MRWFFRYLLISRVGLGGLLARHYTDTNLDTDADASKKSGILDLLSYKLLYNIGPNSLCITQSYYARTASGGGKEGGYLISE